MSMKPRARGFDLVEYRATKFNAVARSLAIPHPVAYAQLADCIAKNWGAIEPFQDSHISMIRPRQHKDKRIIIMDYEKSAVRASRVRRLAFNKRYVARADIATCFPSIYTHAIPWAAVGKAAAKIATKGGWHNDLDLYARRCVRDETQGIPIGPGTSNVIAEIILSVVDKKLAPEFNFVRGGAVNGASRFIDDYSFYCDSYDDAERFIRRLEEELNSFKLRLNARKTSIVTPLAPFSDLWVTELALRLPSGAPLNEYRCTSYLDFATALAQKYPEGSVLKYAASALVRANLSHSAKKATLDYLLVLALANPVLLPLLESLFDSTMLLGHILFPSRVIEILRDSAARHRSDAMAWTLYYCQKYSLAIPDDLADQVIKTEDCIAILALFRTGQHLAKITTWTTGIDKSDAYALDRFWLLLYQLHVNGHVGSDFCSVPSAFVTLKAAGVTFVV
ncbi:MAG: antiviral reverse transcriptase Drt4 [Lysobacteraceae bacterium]